MIPYARHSVTEEDIAAVAEVLRSDFLTQGPAVPRFEQALTDLTGATCCVAVSSATSALHLACLALGIGPGDVLWTSAITFVASANCAAYCGAGIDFVDIEPDTYNLSVESLRAKLVDARRRGCLPKVVVTVHMAGQPVEQETIWALAREFGFRVIEDASHALGAARHGEAVGSCRWSDITVFSFHPAKIITTGEGGAALTNDDELGWRMSLLRTHGITRDPVRMHQLLPGPLDYEQIDLGWNYRMTDLQAALGLSQLSRVESLVDRRNALADRYNDLLAGTPLQLPTVRAENRSAFHLYIVRLGPAAKRTQREVAIALRERGIGVSLHYPPVHLQPYYRERGFTAGSLTRAEQYGSDALTLPLYPALQDVEQHFVAEELARALEA
ncbi:UDP-4-amino-4,6-dideoxy-N-acetyl-beta-L-altrosamine transaminase [soil metagenome]